MTSRVVWSQTMKVLQWYTKSSLQTVDEGLFTSSSLTLLELVHSVADRTQAKEVASSIGEKWKMV